jgi:hypothetical protein
MKKVLEDIRRQTTQLRRLFRESDERMLGFIKTTHEEYSRMANGRLQDPSLTDEAREEITNSLREMSGLFESFTA